MASPTLLSNAQQTGSEDVTTLLSFPIVAGSNRVLNVTVTLEASGDDHFPTSVVIDGNNLVLVNSVTLDTGFHNSVSIWELLESSLPANGNHDIVVTMASSASMGLLISATLFDDLEQITPTGSQLGSGTAANSSSVDADVTTGSESDNVILVGVSSSSAVANWSAPTGFTQISNQSATSFEGALSYKIESQINTLIPINYPATASISRLSGASISYNGFSASGITITAGTTNYFYVAQDSNIELTGEVLLSSLVTNYSYNSKNSIIDLTGEELIASSTTNYSYTAQDLDIELVGTIEILSGVTNYSYAAEALSIILQGQVLIPSSTTNYAYNALNATIILQGPITINPKNIVRVNRKSNAIRVKRTSNIIRVR